MNNKPKNEFGDMNIFVDASYVIYYSVYGAYKMWQNSYKDRYKERISGPTLTDQPDITNDDKFQHCLQKKLEHNMDKIFYVIKNNVYDGSQPTGLRPKVYFIHDANGGKDWRKEIFKEYKAHRKLVPKEFHVSKAFQYIKDVIMPKMNFEEYFGVRSMEVDRAEADDIIMSLISRMKHPHNVIIGTDHDYIQVLDNARMFDLVGKEISAEGISGKITKDRVLSPQEYLKVKCIMGDKSDGIPSIRNKVGPKTAYKIFNDPSLLTEELKDKRAAERYESNINLIDCKNVPVEIQREIINVYRENKIR